MRKIMCEIHLMLFGKASHPVNTTYNNLAKVKLHQFWLASIIYEV